METHEIFRLADLAAIQVEDDEIDAIRDALTDIMTLIDQLQQAPLESLEPLAHPLDIIQTPRADKIAADDRREDILKVAPGTDNGYYIVPPVID